MGDLRLYLQKQRHLMFQSLQTMVALTGVIQFPSDVRICAYIIYRQQERPTYSPDIYRDEGPGPGDCWPVTNRVLNFVGMQTKSEHATAAK